MALLQAEPELREKINARGEYSIKISKSKEELKFVLYKIAPMDINETLWNDEADLLITCM